MIKYPLFFEAHVNSEQEAPTFEAKAENLPPIACAVPKEFGGPGGGYSPEDLFILATVSCLIATFRVFAKKANFSYGGISGHAKLTIDRNGEGIPAFQKLDMTFTLTGVEDQEKAKALIADAEKYCLVSNAIKCEKTFDFKFD